MSEREKTYVEDVNRSIYEYILLHGLFFPDKEDQLP